MEVARFEEDRVKEFKVSLEKFLEGMISRQQEVRAWLIVYRTYLSIVPIADRDVGELSRSSVKEGKRKQERRARGRNCCSIISCILLYTLASFITLANSHH